MTKEEKDDLQDLLVFGLGVILMTTCFYIFGFSSGIEQGRNNACKSIGLKYIEEYKKCMKVETYENK